MLQNIFLPVCFSETFSTNTNWAECFHLIIKAHRPTDLGVASNLGLRSTNQILKDNWFGKQHIEGEWKGRKLGLINIMSKASICTWAQFRHNNEAIYLIHSLIDFLSSSQLTVPSSMSLRQEPKSASRICPFTSRRMLSGLMSLHNEKNSFLKQHNTDHLCTTVTRTSYNNFDDSQNLNSTAAVEDLNLCLWIQASGHTVLNKKNNWPETLTLDLSAHMLLDLPHGTC